ncbi:hypothetical protein ACJRO7_028231 [Eucalyptus globulus]|uniref:Uncharacterized protein n=1 Tax=Eucalyptus globulus TaxID=34317 RepID=A0ABD3K3U9_EUCGL
MYSSNASDGYPQKPGASAPPPPPPVDGIPVQPMNQSYANFGARTILCPLRVFKLDPLTTCLGPLGFSVALTTFQLASCLSFWCPCITFGQIAEIADHGDQIVTYPVHGAIYTVIAFLTGCACCYSCFYRTKMRQQYQLQENPCADCLVHFCCESCALTQEYCELEKCGFDMSIEKKGPMISFLNFIFRDHVWHMNMKRQNRGIPMAPVPPGGMMR